VGHVAAGLIHIIHTLGIMLNSGRLLNWHEANDKPIAGADRKDAPVSVWIRGEVSEH
jgi:hypothetical protein